MKEIRNIAIIAHVDHGKTTLVDSLLKQSETDLGKSAGKDLIMDSNELERERGITIFSKNASVMHKGVKINIIDTPGHADFGGEVERVLNMADGALLLIDAQEGTMPQTRFVLKKALLIGLKIIVVINKIDKPNARINYVLEKTIELFIELGATNDQINFPIVYASGKLGKAGLEPKLETMKSIEPLFETIVEFIPAPGSDAASPLQIMIVSVSYDNYKGKVGVGRIAKGTIKNNERVSRITRDGKITEHKITSLLAFTGLLKSEVPELSAGDIAVIAGIEGINIGDTIASAENPVTLPPVLIEKPTVKMIFSTNNSPFAGTEGKYCTSRNLKERLEKELDNDVALEVVPGKSADEFVVSGRGELHLGILIEKMRRESYELQASRPEVVLKEENGKILEPAEDVWIDVPEKYSGAIIQKMSIRKGELKNMSVENNMASFHFFIPTRGLIGFRNELLLETKGTGVINSLFAGYFPKFGDFQTCPHGSLIAHETGTTTAYGLLNAQERGVMFVPPGVEVYEGQVVGENAKEKDLVVHVCREKQLTNFRAKTDAVTDDLIPFREMTLEQCLEYIGEDELVEVTPKSIRMRKRILKNNLR
ncbi:MAG: GTP-binding protein TypA [Candidatus Jorgensenbacteria bacterium GW2011_GWA1_48_11]|uniref:50S ribosomal subunit assembly factor BipA n=1 Tax=Candidatus Jorgensenbacteria bacterium GW2011_GWA1_48_11 TaxID=1618660 RepID=A0A0G1WKS5_9BACT|nr:MAG: GTP-binding protein TypA [Candidatus Jorgensenbacteria bacterium GW2011_GWA1_48_11]KKW12336.1 MAG: GTP-binding protein TypA [Candidatus Jorgensenbacteria bacterium GW2011_GWB1_49_9]